MMVPDPSAAPQSPAASTPAALPTRLAYQSPNEDLMPVSAGDVIAGGVAIVVGIGSVMGAIGVTIITVTQLKEERDWVPDLLIGLVCVTLCGVGLLVSYLTAKYHFRRRRPRTDVRFL